MISAKPVGNLQKVDKVPVGKVKKTSLQDEIKLVVDNELASLEPQETVTEVIREIPIPPVTSKPELTRDDVVELLKQNYPSIDDLATEILKKLPPMGGGSSWTVRDMPGFKKATNGYVFGVLGNKAGFYDPSVLNIVGGGDDVPYTRLVDTDGDYMYVGECAVGGAEASAVWRIKRIEFLTGANDGDIEIKWADGTASFIKVWNDRATYAYS